VTTYTHCVVCGEEKTLPKQLQKDVPLHTYEQDPYCKRACAEIGHEQPDPRSPSASDVGMLRSSRQAAT
jgi:hypothetical protein